MGVVVLAASVRGPAGRGASAPGYARCPGKAELTVLLTRVMMPFLPLVSFAAVAMGMLNAEERFGLPAFAPAMFNVVTIAVGRRPLGARASARERWPWAGPWARCSGERRSS